MSVSTSLPTNPQHYVYSINLRFSQIKLLLLLFFYFQVLMLKQQSIGNINRCLVFTQSPVFIILCFAAVYCLIQQQLVVSWSGQHEKIKGYNAYSIILFVMYQHYEGKALLLPLHTIRCNHIFLICEILALHTAIQFLYYYTAKTPLYHYISSAIQNNLQCYFLAL